MTDNSRSRYQKPTLEKVKLVAKEAVLTGCKSPNAFGPHTDLQGNPMYCLDQPTGHWCQIEGT